MGLIILLLSLAVIAADIVALVDVVRRPGAYFTAAGKLTKPIWLGILAVSLVLTYLTSIFSLFGLAAAIATIVYYVDVRPALRNIGGGSY